MGCRSNNCASIRRLLEGKDFQVFDCEQNNKWNVEDPRLPDAGRPAGPVKGRRGKRQPKHRGPWKETQERNEPKEVPGEMGREKNGEGNRYRECARKVWFVRMRTKAGPPGECEK